MSTPQLCCTIPARCPGRTEGSCGRSGQFRLLSRGKWESSHLTLKSSEQHVLAVGATRSPRSPLVPTGKGKRPQLARNPESPNSNDTQAVHDRLAKVSHSWAPDLFSGALGLSLVLQQAGFAIIAAADTDPRAADTHAANIQSLTWCGDLTDPSGIVGELDRWEIDHVKLLAGGPLCQSFSRAGVAKIAHLVRATQRSTSGWSSANVGRSHRRPRHPRSPTRCCGGLRPDHPWAELQGRAGAPSLLPALHPRRKVYPGA